MDEGDKVTGGSDKDTKLQGNLLLTPKQGEQSFFSATESWAQGFSAHIQPSGRGSD